MPESASEYDYLARGQMLLQRGNFSAAIADFDQAISINTGLAAAYYYRGIAQRNSGKCGNW